MSYAYRVRQVVVHLGLVERSATYHILVGQMEVWQMEHKNQSQPNIHYVQNHLSDLPSPVNVNNQNLNKKRN